jgi:hypothetical protein
LKSRGFQVCGYKKNKSYFAAGAAAGVFAGPGAVAGNAGGAAGFGTAGTACLVTGADAPSIKADVFLDAVYVKVIDVSIKIMATAAVIFPRKVPAPLEPKTVWLDPPKAAPIFAPLPACSKTIKIKVIQAKMCMMVNNVVIFYVLFYIN